MGQCCANSSDRDHEVYKSSNTTIKNSQGNLNNSRDYNEDLQLSEVENSFELQKHGPPPSLAIKIKTLPAHLSAKVEELARTQPKFEFRNDNEIVEKAIFLGLRQLGNNSICIGQWYIMKRNGRG